MNKAIYWFRKNLRINDNPSLYNAIKENDEVICIYIKTTLYITHQELI